MAYSTQPQEVKVVGSSTFGVFPKISLEQTWNMFVSDNWLINFPGWKRIFSTIDGNEGRGIFYSSRGNIAIIVVDNNVYKANDALGSVLVGTIGTRTGEVFIDENLSSQVCIVDGNNAYIYNYSTGDFTVQTLTVNGGAFVMIPGYVCYHNSFFLIAPSENDSNSTSDWYAFQRATDSTITHVTESTFPLQVKPDFCVAVKRLPGKANHVIAIGRNVCQVYTNVGGLENYRPSSQFNIDSGTVSRSTIAGSDEFVAFLSQNEESTPAILLTDGTSKKLVSTDGIDNFLRTIKRPDLSTAYFYRQNGHLFYILTFYYSEDNTTLAYDVTSDKFYYMSDQKFNYHPARQVAIFGGRPVFVSLAKGYTYELNPDLDGVYEDVDSNDGETIPHLRITNTLRYAKRQYFKQFMFLVEQGVTSFPALHEGVEVCFNAMLTEDGEEMLTEDGQVMLAENGYCSTELHRPRIDLSMSKNGNQSFSNIVGVNMNPEGKYRNVIQWHRLGFGNEITFQIAFWGLNRFVAQNGQLEASQ